MKSMGTGVSVCLDTQVNCARPTLTNVLQIHAKIMPSAR